MNEIIQRLKTSQERANATSTTAGERAGQEWARKHAEVAELRRLARALNSINGRQFEEGGAAVQFVWIINPNETPNWSNANDFWRDVTWEEELPDQAFVAGFASGALDLWDEVRHQL
jgi:hypothetical protein